VKLRLSALVACLLVPASIAAQDRRWEIEGYGGITAAQSESAGTVTLPAAGGPLVTSNPIFPTRETPSWLFGDGAALLNGVVAAFDRSARVVPLDAAFGPLESSPAPVLGVRVRRRVSARYALELSLDAQASHGIDADAVPAIVEASRASFTAAFTDLLASGPFTGASVVANASTQAGSRRDIALTGALVRTFRPLRALAPYVTVGAGVIAGIGSMPSASLEARYRFSVLGELPIDESDRLSFRYARGAAFIAVLGGGMRRDLSSDWGVRIDARVLLGPDPTRVVVDAQPSSVRGVPAGFIESFTNPGVQFSNDPSTGRRSTLSGPGLQAADVFTGGFHARTIVTVGITRRFQF
jgi:hypothetical protein